MTIYEKRNLKIKGIIMKKTFLKKLVTASIAAVTALSVFRGVPTFADTNDDNLATARATGESDAKVAINKTLKIAEGITTPNATFTFTFTPQTGTSSNGAPYETGTNIPDQSVTFLSSDVLKPNEDSIKKDTTNIFYSVRYNHAGEYVYRVAEKNDGWHAISKNGTPIDYMTYDTRTYDMHVIVKNKSRENGTYISSVYFKETSNTNGAKVKPSTGSETYKYDLFSNIYRKDAGKITDPNDPKPNNPDQANIDPTANSLVIKKVVSGSSADKTKNFTFKLTFKKASTEEASSINGSIDGVSKTFEYDRETTITLRHNQTLVFKKIPAGTKYKLVEVSSKGYTASSELKSNGLIKTQNGTKSQDFTQENILVGEKPNNNTITNSLPDVTPTGLLIDNLPFILMIGLGLAGFVVLSKKRRQA